MFDALEKVVKKLGDDFFLMGPYTGKGDNRVKSVLEQYKAAISPCILDQTVKFWVLLSNIKRDYGEMNVNYRKWQDNHLNVDYYSTRVTFQPLKMPKEGSSIALGGIVYNGDEKIEPITTGTRKTPYSPALKIGNDILILSGQIGNVDSKTNIVKGSTLKQWRRVVIKSNKLIESAGFTFEGDSMFNCKSSIECYYTNESDLGKLKTRFNWDFPYSKILPMRVGGLPFSAKVELADILRKK